MRQITLFALRELHVPILMRVYESLIVLNIPEVQVSFSSVTFLKGTPDWPEEGLHESTINKLSNQGITFIEHHEGLRFDCVVTADACYDRIDGWGPVVCVGHGTISKNIFFIDQLICRRENYADILCVPGPFYTEQFGDMVHTQIEATGFPKLDALTEPIPKYAIDLLEQLGWTDSKIILYAPTYNLEMCSLEIMETPLYQLADSGFKVLIKLHGATQEVFVTKYKNASSHHNIHFLTDEDIIPWMQLSHLLISDVSSVYVEYLLLNKPIYLYDHPQLKKCAYYNPKAVEFQVRDNAYRFQDAWMLKPLIEKTLSIDPLKSAREQSASKLFPPLDGRNSERVAQSIARVIDAPSSYPIYRKKYLYLSLINQNSDIDLIQSNLSRLTHLDDVYTWNRYDQSLDSKNEINLLKARLRSDKSIDGIIILEGRYLFPRELDKIHAMNQEIWEPRTQIQFPILQDLDESYYQKQSLVLPQRLSAEESKIQLYTKHVYFPDSKTHIPGQWDGSMILAGVALTMIDYLESAPDSFDWFYFQKKNPTITTKTVFGVYGYQP